MTESGGRAFIFGQKFGTGGKIGFKQKPSIYAGFAVQKSVHILEKQQNPYQNRRLDL